MLEGWNNFSWDEPSEKPLSWEEAMADKISQPDISTAEYLGELTRSRSVEYGNIVIACFADHQRYSGPFVRVPFSSLPWISISRDDEDSIYSQTCRAGEVYRLSDIPQLSMLNDPTHLPQQTVLYPTFNHSRLEHSYVVAAVTEIVLRNNGRDTDVPKGVIAGLLHDTATVAGGDVMKMVAPKELSEEKLVERILHGEEMVQHLRNYGLKPEEVASVIRNEGTLGQVLDIVDRLAYTAVDAKAMMGIYKGNNGDYNSPFVLRMVADESEGFFPEKGREVAQILKGDPTLFDVIFDIGIAGEQVYVKDATRLNAFLQLRCYLHRDLYMDPVAHFGEVILLPELRALYEQTSIDELLSMGNRGLREKIADRFSAGAGFMLEVAVQSRIEDNDIQVEVCKKDEEIEATKQHLASAGRKIHTIWDYRRGFNPATNILVEHDGLLVPFKEAHPEAAEAIDAIVDQVKTARIYHGIGV